MATGVFGLPVTKNTLVAAGLFDDIRKVTQKDVASYAETMMTADGRDTDALKYVQNLKSDYGNGVSTLFVFYNATGSTLTFVKSHDYFGKSFNIPCPSQIENGQWGAFLHVHIDGTAVGSSGAVVYRGEFNSNTNDWLLSWDVPWWFTGSNKVYTEIRGKDHWPAVGSWSYICDMRLGKSDKHSWDKQNGLWSDIIIAAGTSPVVRAILKLV